MIRANFNAYNTYVTDSLYQWDIDQVLSVSGLNLAVAPEVHFSNSNMDRAIVRQAKIVDHVVIVDIPNSLLQEPFAILADIGIYEGTTFKTVETVRIPVKAKKRPNDYQLQDSDEEIYSFKRLENELANKADNSRIDNIIAHNNDTNGNTELIDARVGVDGGVYVSVGSAVRKQMRRVEDILASVAGQTSEIKGAYFTQGGAVQPNNRIHAADIKCSGLAVIRYNGADKTLRYGVDVYTDDSSRIRIAASGWMKASANPTFIVSQSGVIDVSIAKDSDYSFDKLSDMDGLFTVTIYDTLSDVRRDLTSTKNSKHWLTSAHRGFVNGVMCENTLAAFYNAYLNGADMIEADARLSKDGVLICNHDATVTGIDASGSSVTYTVANTAAATICNLVLSDDNKWGTQKVPTLEQVLTLAYHTGLIVNIDLKDGYAAAEAVAKLVLKCGMRGRVIYATNGSGMQTINKILEFDNDAKFIDTAANFTATNLSGLPDYRSRCYAYTGNIDAASVSTIRDSGCMLALISLDADRFKAAMAYYPDMCEFLHTSDFNAIEDAYFKVLKLY